MSNAPAGRPVPSTGQSAPRPTATADRTVYLVGHAHLDPVWLWPWQEGYQEARATFRSALDRMNEYPDFVFTCDQIVLLSWVEESDPELFAEIAARVAEGRWVHAGGWWVEPDCNMPGAESFVRQGLWSAIWRGERGSHRRSRSHPVCGDTHLFRVMPSTVRTARLSLGGRRTYACEQITETS
jgi:alpha-mannosidase